MTDKESIITGFHAIEETLKTGGRGKIYFCSKSGKRVYDLVEFARTKNLETISLTMSELDNLSGGRDHRGILLAVKGEVHKDTPADLDAWISVLQKDEALVMVLDGITDPHNYGAILRSADQFGVDLILTATRRAAPDSTVAVNTSAGALQYVPVLRVVNLRRALQDLKKNGFWVYGTDMQGQDIWSEDLAGRVVLVMGSEGKGVGRLLEAECDTLLKIPMQGHVDSLNVSVAAGICLYEISRQRASRIIRSAK